MDYEEMERKRDLTINEIEKLLENKPYGRGKETSLTLIPNCFIMESVWLLLTNMLPVTVNATPRN